MDIIVFNTDASIKADTYTTSDTIAKYAAVSRDSVNRLIRRYKSDLEEFGKLIPEIVKPLPGSKGGHPRKVWHLNELQATTLITYLDNTKPVREFKKALVKQFYSMQQELLERRVTYQAAKPLSKSLGDSINASAAFEGNPHAYGNMNALVYRQALGMTAKQLRDSRDIPKHGAITQYLTAKETTAVTKVKSQVSMLLDMGLDYSHIKEVLTSQGIVYNITLNAPEPAAAQ